MFCSISGVAPEEPVVCIKSGYVYEKRLILKQIELSGTDPVTGVEITASDLLPIQSSHVSAPKPISATSVQGLLGALQSEWDALMLETFTLRQTLETTRQELSQALYQHDAACRVIARLIQERDAARSSLASTQAMLAQLNASGDIASLAKTQAPGGLSQELIQAIVDKNRLLSKNRKNRAIPADSITDSDVRSLRLTSDIVLSASFPGLSSINVAVAHVSPDRRNHVFVAGNGNTASIYDMDKKAVVAKLVKNADNVTSIAYHPDPSNGTIATGAADGSLRIYNIAVDSLRDASNVQESSPIYTLSPYPGRCISVSFLPVGTIVFIGYADGTWALVDSVEGKLLIICPPKDNVEVTSWQVHPDGMLLCAAATDGSLYIYDVCSQNLETRLQGSGSPILAFAFSENGYFVAIGGKDGSIALWDLRKIGSPKGHVVHTWHSKSESSVQSVAFDYSGKFLASGHTDGSIYVWDTTRKLATDEGDGCLVALSDTKSLISGISWAPLGRVLLSVSSNHNSIGVYTTHGMDQE